MKIRFTAEYHSPASKKDHDSVPGSYSHETYELDWEGENVDDLFNMVIDFDNKWHKKCEEREKTED